MAGCIRTGDSLSSVQAHLVTNISFPLDEKLRTHKQKMKGNRFYGNCLGLLSTLYMQTGHSYETSVNFRRTTRRHIPEESLTFETYKYPSIQAYIEAFVNESFIIVTRQFPVTIAKDYQEFTCKLCSRSRKSEWSFSLM
jgi:hypothetical protein